MRNCCMALFLAMAACSTPVPPPDRPVDAGKPAPVVQEKQAPEKFHAGRPYLGLVPEYANDEEGVLLQGVSEGSPAEKAGLKADDVIVAFDGEAVADINEYSAKFYATKPGQKIVLTVKRGGKEKDFEVVVGHRPSEE